MRLISSYANLLSKPFVDERFTFNGTVLAGISSPARPATRTSSRVRNFQGNSPSHRSHADPKPLSHAKYFTMSPQRRREPSASRSIAIYTLAFEQFNCFITKHVVFAIPPICV
ncbi:hypothetical protein [Massilia sp. TWR1-2-2]|uniref:hypothetical protein n=1 Tax=Massilia sp. TWR1-2-2 TaxID=2804584 RepID=UPI003CF8C1B9